MLLRTFILQSSQWGSLPIISAKNCNIIRTHFFKIYMKIPCLLWGILIKIQELYLHKKLFFFIAPDNSINATSLFYNYFLKINLESIFVNVYLWNEFFSSCYFSVFKENFNVYFSVNWSFCRCSLRCRFVNWRYGLQ